MILVRLKGGLGNQLFQYATGFALARRRQTELWLDLSHYARFKDRAVELGHLQVDLRIAGTSHLLRHRCFPHTPWGDRLTRFQRRLLPAWVQPYRREDPAVDPARLLADRRATLFIDGYWQNEQYFADCAPELRWRFRPRPERLPSLADARDLVAGCDVAIHVRRGDYVRDQAVGRTMGVLDQDHYRRALGLLGGPRSIRRVALFSDEPEWVLQHWDLGVQLVAIAGARTAMASSAVADLELMAGARALVTANSTLSWWAGWLGDRPDRPVVVPSPWAADPTLLVVPTIPTHWIRA